jgi:hypothetical protein
MSSGYYRFACLDTADAHIVADEGHGSYPEITVSVFPTETADRSAVIQEIHLTHEQWAELLQQWNEYREHRGRAAFGMGAGGSNATVRCASSARPTIAAHQERRVQRE